MRSELHTWLDENFAGGGEKELELAIKLYGESLFRYCLNICCNFHDAQDATQTAFIKAYENRSKFLGKATLSTWLYKIAYNTCVDLLRKKKVLVFVGLEKESLGNTELQPFDEVSEEVISALKKLSPKERAIVFGRAFEEKSYAELSQIHGATEAVLRKRYERAKKKLGCLLSGTDASYGRV